MRKWKPRKQKEQRDGESAEMVSGSDHGHIANDGTRQLGFEVSEGGGSLQERGTKSPEWGSSARLAMRTSPPILHHLA